MGCFKNTIVNFALRLCIKVKNVLDEVLEKLPEEFNMAEIMQKSTSRSPYVLVCFQECERMNILIREIRRSLKQLDLGLKVRGIIFVFVFYWNSIKKESIYTFSPLQTSRANWHFLQQWKLCSHHCFMTWFQMRGWDWLIHLLMVLHNGKYTSYL